MRVIFEPVPDGDVRDARFGRIRVAAARYSGPLRLAPQQHRLVLLVAHHGGMLLRSGIDAVGTRTRIPWRRGLLLANPEHARITPSSEKGRHQVVAVSIPLSAVEAPLMVGTALANGRDSVLPLDPRSLIVGSAEPFVAQVLEGHLQAGSMFSVQMELLLQQIMRTLIVEATADSEPGHESLYARALSLIAQRYSEQGLSSETIAAEAGCSRRRLERVFQQQDDTIARAVRRARIDAAERLLHHGASPRPTVAQTATLVGYASGANLARAMATEGRPSPRAPRS